MADTTLSQRLRAATEVIHQQTESLPFAARLMAPDLDRDTYARTLARMLGVIGPLEAAVTEADRDGALGFLPLPQAGSIVADLFRLGWDEGRVGGLPLAPLPPGLDITPAAAGVAYLLDGSLLGGRVVARRLRDSLGPEVAGSLSFHADDPAASQQWQLCRAWLDGLPADWADGAEAGALSAFTALRDWMAGAP
ncbi:biliverdin-producing heme oxygenase [Aerophototrophica crusticola]|uniref:Biliverdin-producing heme oxygenase n=1 Tax=Aerophototrophica crusticola TaxID=1709002 RepID=A0A858RBP0_9PROT|nr:biliverdin-producing heme oxygenase [Rhodospirillaceae bacterium B3]